MLMPCNKGKQQTHSNQWYLQLQNQENWVLHIDVYKIYIIASPGYKKETRPLWKTAKLFLREGELFNTDHFNEINWENKFYGAGSEGQSQE